MAEWTCKHLGQIPSILIMDPAVLTLILGLILAFTHSGLSKKLEGVINDKDSVSISKFRPNSRYRYTLLLFSILYFLVITN